MERKVDLTTKSGILAAIEDLGFQKDQSLLLIPGLGPFAYLGKKAYEAAEKMWGATESTIQEQRKTAVEIIKAGRDCGADSLEVTLDQKAGIDLGSDLEGIPIKIMAGKNGGMTIKVKYK